MATAVVGVLAAALFVALFTSSAVADRSNKVTHVLLISVDGLHQSDLEWFVANNSSSALAKLVHGGAEFSPRADFLSVGL